MTATLPPVAPAAPRRTTSTADWEPSGPLVGGRPRATAAAAFASFLAALTLTPVFQEAGWIPPTALVIALVGVVGWLARLARLPGVLHPLLQAAALLATMTRMFAPEHAWGGFLPGPVALADLRAVVQAGLADAEKYTSPAPESIGLTALVVGGLGLAALAVDTVSVGLRQPAIAGIPLLAVYAVPVAVLRGGAPWWLIVLPAAGWLLMLVVDEKEQLGGWGRVLTSPREVVRRAGAGPRAHPTRPRPPRLSGLSGQARWMAVAALAAALLIPAVIPGLTEPIWGTGRGGGDGAGGVAPEEGAVTLDPFVSLRRGIVEQNDRELIRYVTADPNPSYLRLATLETFDGTTWRAADFPGRVPLSEVLPPPAAGVSESQTIRYDIAVGDLDNSELPLPFPARQVYAEGDNERLLQGDWSWQPTLRTASADDDSSLDLTYAVDVYDQQPDPNVLRAASSYVAPELVPLLEVPEDLPSSLTLRAEQVTRDATTRYDQAPALQRWFTNDGGFTYSTSVESGNDAAYLDQFLTERVGYCEQFAATMALMARTLGIPSRVVVGFTSGEQNAEGAWSVTVRDAHAWPELWFADVGWVRFEPTPRTEAGAGVVAPPYVAGDVDVDTGDGSAQEPVADPAERRGLREVEASEVARILAELERSQSASDADAWRRSTLLGLGVVVVVVLLVPVTVRFVRRRRRLAGDDPVALAEGAWAEVRDSTRDVGRTWSDAATPRRMGAWLYRDARLDQEPADALRRIVLRLEKARYGRAADPADGTGHDVRLVRRALLHRAAWRTRLRATLLPPSVLRRRRRDSGALVTSAQDGARGDQGVERGAELVGAGTRE